MASIERREEALLVWLNVFSKQIKDVPELKALKDVWIDHLGPLGYLCHAQQLQKKSFTNPAEAFKDTKFVLEDLQTVKNDDQKIMYFEEIDFDAAANGEHTEIYKCVLLMVAEVLIYFKSSECALDLEEYILALGEREHDFAAMMEQVINNTGSSWWDCIGANEPKVPKFVQPRMPNFIKEDTNPTTPKKPRMSTVSLFSTPAESHSRRVSNAVGALGTTPRSPLQEVYYSPRMSMLADSMNVRRLKNRIDELGDDLSVKDNELKEEIEKRLVLVNDNNNLKQVASERLQDLKRSEERIEKLEAELHKLKLEHKCNVVKMNEAVERKDKYKLQLEEDEVKMEELLRERNEFEEKSRCLAVELRDALERQNTSDRVEKSLESKVISLQNEIAHNTDELETAMGQWKSDRKTFKEQMEEKQQEYENMLFDERTKLAQMDRTITEKNEEIQLISNDFRLRLQNEQKECEQKIAGIKATLENELERHQLLLKQQIDDSNEEKQRYATEIQMLNEMLSNTLRGKTDEHDQMVTALKRQHELELMSVKSKMELNEQMIERQKEDVARYKNEVVSIQEQLLRSQEAELAACNKQNEIVSEKDTEITRLRQNIDNQRQMQVALETERASLMAKKDETDRYLREEVAHSYELLKEAQIGIMNLTTEREVKVKEMTEMREELEKMRLDHQTELANLRSELEQRVQFVPPSVKKEEVSELASFSAATNLDSTVVKSLSFNDSSEKLFENRIHDEGDEEPMQMEQSSIGTKKTESFFVDFDRSTDTIENEDGSTGRHTDVCSRLSLASVSRISLTSANSMFSEGRASSAHSAIPEIPANYAMYAPKETDRERIEVLKRRNNANPPALRSSYATEFTNYTSPNGSENSIKGIKKQKSTLGKLSSNITKSFIRPKRNN